MLLLGLLCSCSDSGICANSAQCGDGRACIQNEDATGTCFPLCATQSGCAEGEFCVPRVEEAENVVLVWPEVCVPSELLFPPTGCEARSIDDCALDSDCSPELGWRLDRERRCRERLPAGCSLRVVACLDAGIFEYNTAGEIFYFSQICSRYGFTKLSVEPGDPLYEELFGMEPSAHNWPDCE